MSESGVRELLTQSPLFAGLPQPSLDDVLQAVNLRMLPAKTVLFHQGDAPKELIVLGKGIVKVWQMRAGGDPATIHMLGPGDLVGAVAVFRQIPFPATATAVTDCILLSWAAARTNELMDSSSSVSSPLILRHSSSRNAFGGPRAGRGTRARAARERQRRTLVARLVIAVAASPLSSSPFSRRGSLTAVRMETGSMPRCPTTHPNLPGPFGRGEGTIRLGHSSVVGRLLLQHASFVPVASSVGTRRGEVLAPIVGSVRSRFPSFLVSGFPLTRSERGSNSVRSATDPSTTLVLVGAKSDVEVEADIGPPQPASRKRTPTPAPS